MRFLGARGAYARLLARGAVLLVVTLGLYRFWLMTDVGRFLWSHTEIDGETLEYAGTRLELLIGFLVAVVLLVPIYAGAVLQGAGLSVMFGMLLGDFVGGGAVVVAAKSVLQSSYSRDVEAAADVYGVDLMRKAGGNGHALATILARIGGAIEPGMKILRDHPDTKARVAVIERLAHGAAGQAMLSPAEWSALRGICKG